MENRIILIMLYFWHKLLLNQLNRRKPFGKSIAFSIAFIVFNSFGLTTVQANEPIQTIDLQQSVNVKSSDRAFRSFKSIVDRYDCLSPSAETRSNEIKQIERTKFAKDLKDCTDRIRNIAEIANSRWSVFFSRRLKSSELMIFSTIHLCCN